MKRIVTTLWVLAFLISGVLVASIPHSSSSTDSFKMANAGTMVAAPVVNPNSFVLPHDLLLDLAKKQGSNGKEVTALAIDSATMDSLKQRIAYLEQKEQVTKVKRRKVPVPKPIVLRDTIREAHYYLATQVGNKEGPTGECIAIYEVHKIDSLCPEITNSYMERVIKHDGSAGD